MKNKNIIIAFVVIVIAIWLVVIARTPLETTKDPIVLTEDTDAYKEAYMEGCLEGGVVSYDYCDCTYEYMVDTYGLSAIMHVAVDYLETDDVPDEMTEAVDYCLNVEYLERVDE